MSKFNFLTNIDNNNFELTIIDDCSSDASKDIERVNAER